MNSLMPNTTRFILMTAALAGLSGCSMTYSRAWNNTVARPATEDTLAGRWQGQWLSTKNGHHGALRCIVTRTGVDEYRFHYWARFWKVFSATYKITITTETAEGEIRFGGSEDLGFFYGGVYSHEGKVVGDRLSATYRCKIDHGTFDMTKME